MTNQRGPRPQNPASDRVTPGGQPQRRAAYTGRSGRGSAASAALLLIHFLSGPNIPRWRPIETAAGGLDFGLRCALALRVGLCRRGTVLRDVISNDGTRRAMDNALTGRCRRRQRKNGRENKQQAKPHSGSFLLQIDYGRRA